MSFRVRACGSPYIRACGSLAAALCSLREDSVPCARWSPHAALAWHSPATLALGACEATAPPPRPARTVANSRRTGPARAAAGGQGPPPVDSAARCTPETNAALARVRYGRTIAFGPLCTDAYNGRFSGYRETNAALLLAQK